MPSPESAPTPEIFTPEEVLFVAAKDFILQHGRPLDEVLYKNEPPVYDVDGEKLPTLEYESPPIAVGGQTCKVRIEYHYAGRQEGQMREEDLNMRAKTTDGLEQKMHLYYEKGNLRTMAELELAEDFEDLDRGALTTEEETLIFNMIRSGLTTDEIEVSLRLTGEDPTLIDKIVCLQTQLLHQFLEASIDDIEYFQKIIAALKAQMT